MLQLAYLSHVADGVTWEDTCVICEQAQNRNRADEITGVLLADGKCFIQVLEGPQFVVENTFLRLIVDARHHSLTLLSRRLVTSREFGAWDMALVKAEIDRRHFIERVRQLASGASEKVRQLFFACYPTHYCGDLSPAKAPYSQPISMVTCFGPRRI